MNILESSTDGGRQIVIKELEHQKTLIMELRDTVLPIIGPHNRYAELVRRLFEDVFSCSGKAISFLEYAYCSSKRDRHADLVGAKRRFEKHGMENRILEEKNKDTGNKRRKNAQHTGSLVTQEPHYDGFLWRKYGQKCISKAKYSRSYYRCATQGCPATKTVQQKETTGGGLPRLFNVDYYGQHICNRCDTANNPYAVGERSAHQSVQLADRSHCSSSSDLANELHHGVQDESFEDMFMETEMMPALFLTEVDTALHAYGVETPSAHRTVPQINYGQCDGSDLVYDVHGVQDQSFEEVFMVPDMMPDHLTDVEMAVALGAAMNLPNNEPWGFDETVGSERQSPLSIWS